MELLALLYDILQKARKEGLMSIEKDVEDPHSRRCSRSTPGVGNDHHVTEFITDYLRMMVSGNLNAHEIESLMDSEIDTHHARGARAGGGDPARGRRRCRPSASWPRCWAWSTPWARWASRRRCWAA
jgi:chemotaxis protein MotA